MSKPKTVNEIIEIFIKEFKPIANKFEIIEVLRGQEFTAQNITEAKQEFIWHPGVYVFYNAGKVYRVGRHFTNSRMRVLQHIADNTKTDKDAIVDLLNSNEAEVILFNVKDIKDYHWVAAVEVFLENELKPLIPALRQW